MKEIIFRDVFWLPFGWRGMAIRPFIFLRKGAEFLLEHERFHHKQQKEHGLSYYFKYALSKEFRFQIEVEAYVGGSKMSLFDAMRMARKYI